MSLSARYTVVLYFKLAIRSCVFVGLSLLLGCGSETRDCRLVTAERYSTGNAGCWLVAGNKILLVEQQNGRFSFPGGTSKPGESAQCTAHRETWEEAGVDVSVGGLKYQFSNGFKLYHCFSDTTVLQTNDRLEIKRVLVVDPQLVPEDQWRFPSQRQRAIEWLNVKP